MGSKLQILQIKIFIAENCKKLQKNAQKSFCNKVTSLIIIHLRFFHTAQQARRAGNEE